MHSDLDTDAAVRQATLFTRVTGVPCVVLDRRGGLRHPEAAGYPCRLCRSLVRDPPADRAPPPPHGVRHLKWVDEAVRFGGQSIFLCEHAFTHWTAPILADGSLVGALVAGPVLTFDDTGFLESELLSAPHTVATAPLRRLLAEVVRMEPSLVTVHADLLTQLARALSTGGDPRLSAETLAQQSRIGELVQELKVERSRTGADPDAPTYPLDKELELLEHIRTGAVKPAQATLNELLTHVFFAAGSEMAQVRMRARELVVLLSRAVVGEGADPEEVFGLNYQFATAIDHQTDINGVAYWMARIVRRFADFVLYTPHLTHARSLRLATQLVRSNLHRRVTVDEAAAAAGMSGGHFSRVFRAELGESYVAYVNRMRCEHAASLLRTTDMPLAEVAAACGFGDHSYFSRVFRATTGETPGGYRRS